MIDLDDVKGNSRDRRPSASDLVSVYKFPEKKWVSVRLFGGMQPEAGYWVKTKKKGGKPGKFYTACPSFDPTTQERDSTKYDPWRDVQLVEAEAIRNKEMDREDGKVQFSSHFWINGIIRAEQKRAPGKLPKPSKSEVKSGFKDKDSDSWTAVRAIKVGKSLAGKLKELKPLNLVKSKETGATKAFAVSDVKYGRDVSIYFDPDKAPADQYQVQLGEKRTPLSEEEQAMLKWDLSQIGNEKFDPKVVKADFEGWASRNGVSLKKGKKSKDEDEDDGDSDDESDDDEDFDDEPKSKKSKGKSKPEPKKGKGKKSKDEDDEDGDEDEDDSDSDDDEDDFDDEPKSKKSKSKKSQSKKPKDDEDEEDEDEEDEEDEDEDDSDSDDEDDEDEDDSDSDDDEDDEDAEEDDEPAPKKGKKSKPEPKSKKSKGKKSKDEDEDDDFDDEDDEDSDSDDEDDEEDEPAPKKKAKGKSKPEPKKADKKAKKGKGKKSKDEDEDDDIPF